MNLKSSSFVMGDSASFKISGRTRMSFEISRKTCIKFNLTINPFDPIGNFFIGSFPQEDPLPILIVTFNDFINVARTP